MRIASRLSGLVLAGALFAACGGSPAPPTTPTLPPVQPPPVVPAPVITSVGTTVTRAEAGEDVTFTAVVEDGNPTASALSYQWSASAGIITGNGASATWRLTPGAISEGVNVVVTLTVVKPYQVLENNQLLNREYRITKGAAAFRAHDSRAEISRITLKFLVDLFGDFSKSPDACLVDFSDLCPGKDDEYGNIVDNRKDRQILSATANVASILFKRNNTEADIVAPCVFRDIDRKTGIRYTVTGNCVLTAVYEQQRWWLCASHFLNGVSVPSALPARVGRGMRYWQ